MDDIPVVGPLWLNGLLCLLGFLAHTAIAWHEYRRDVAKIGFVEYVRDNPSGAVVSVTTSAFAFVGTWSVGWMNPGMAMACGYMANSVVNKLVQRELDKSP